MTSYNAIVSGEIDADSPITADLMSKLRDNPIAISEGSSGAPKVLKAALNVTLNTVTGSVVSGTTDVINLGGLSFFPSVEGTALQVNVASSVTANADSPRISITTGTGSPVAYTVKWKTIT